MELGQFSISLPVKDMSASVEFYQKLGFEVIDGGHMNKSFKDTENTIWRIMQSGHWVIGLFQGMFENFLLTFNPSDVRTIQRHLKKEGVPLIKEADENTSGPDHILMTDPDGHTIMFDQHND